MRVSFSLASAALTASLGLVSLAQAAPTLVQEAAGLQHAFLDAQTGVVTFAPPANNGGELSIAPGPIFSSLSPNVGLTTYSAFPAANYLGFDDYDSIADYTTEPVVPLYAVSFIGGVTTAGQSLTFNFYLNGGATPVTSFSSTFGTAGNFLWTVNNINIPIPSDGELELAGTTATDTGRWFLANSAPTIGTQSTLVGSTQGGASAAFSHRFELVVPEPVSLSALALALPFVARRRKA